MDDTYILIALVVGSLLLVAGAVIYSHLRARQRTEALGQVAVQMGFSFHAKGDAAFQAGLGSFPLLSRGRSRRFSNLLLGSYSREPAAVFDYRYVTGSGKSSRTWHQTVVCLTLRGALLPSFSLSPEHVFHKVGGWLGMQDIDFESRPEFSDRYLLRGADEEAIRALFGDGVLGFFERNPGLTVEGEGEQLLFYRTGKRVRPEELREFLELGTEAMRLFRSSLSDDAGSSFW